MLLFPARLVPAPPPRAQDPLSLGSSDRAISSRLDLAADAEARDAYGGIDCKVTAASLRLATWARAGPTADDQAPFAWSAWSAAQNWSGAIHPGQPDRFDFPFFLLALARELPPISGGAGGSDAPLPSVSPPPTSRAQSVPPIMTWLPDALMAALALSAVAACAACWRWRAEGSAGDDTSSSASASAAFGDGSRSRSGDGSGSTSATSRVMHMLGGGIELEAPAYTGVHQHEEEL